MTAYMQQWFFRPQTQQALLLACIALSAGTLGVHLAHYLPMKGASRHYELTDYQNRVFTQFGFILILAGVVLWLYEMIRLGSADVLISSYANYLQAVSSRGGFIGWLYYVIALGMVFLAATKRTRLRQAGFTIFGIFVIIGLPLGLRGEVLFPTSAALTVIALRKPIISTRTTLILALSGLIAISFLKDIRQYGLSGLSNAEISGSMAGGMAELGSTIRTVSETIRWHEVLGEDYIYGASYWAPFDRALAIIPGWYRLPAAEDDRLLNVLVQRRVGPIGYSPVAEAFRNFGLVGVIAVMFLVGFLLGRMDRWPITHYHQLRLGIILVPLLIQIRNSFTSVPAQWVIGFAILYIAVFVADIPSSKQRKLEGKST